MIVKPDFMSQGKGIFLTYEIDKIDLKDISVVQEYINRPYLLDGLKFDMRIYVLVVSCEPLRIYIHREGLVRFCTQQYVPLRERGDYSNMFVHLTNYSLNKDSGNFTQPTSVDDNTGHKWTITNLYKRLRQDGIDTEAIQA